MPTFRPWIVIFIPVSKVFHETRVQFPASRVFGVIQQCNRSKYFNLKNHHSSSKTKFVLVYFIIKPFLEHVRYIYLVETYNLLSYHICFLWPSPCWQQKVKSNMKVPFVKPIFKLAFTFSKISIKISRVQISQQSRN